MLPIAPKTRERPVRPMMANFRSELFWCRVWVSSYTLPNSAREFRISDRETIARYWGHLYNNTGRCYSGSRYTSRTGVMSSGCLRILAWSLLLLQGESDSQGASDRWWWGVTTVRSIGIHQKFQSENVRKRGKTVCFWSFLDLGSPRQEQVAFQLRAAPGTATGGSVGV